MPAQIRILPQQLQKAPAEQERSPEAYGAGAWAAAYRAGQQLQEEALAWGKEAMQKRHALQDQQDRIDAQTKLDQLKIHMIDYEQELRQSPEGIDPDLFPQQMQARAQQMTQYAQTTMKPGAATKFQLPASAWLTATTIKAKKDAEEFRQAKLGLTGDQQFDRYLEQAGAADNDEAYKHAVLMAQSMVEGQLSSGGWAKDHAGHQQQRLYSDSVKAAALGRYERLPGQREELISQLLAGTFNPNAAFKLPGMGPVQQKELGALLQSKMEAQQKREEEAAEKAHKKLVEQQVGELWQLAADKVDDGNNPVSREQLVNRMDAMRLPRGDRLAILEIFEKEKKEAPSDEDTRQEVDFAVRMQRPTITQREIIAYNARGLLNRTDATNALGILKSSLEHIDRVNEGQANRALTRQIQDYNAHIKWLEVNHGITSPFETLGQEGKKAYIAGFNEFFNRAHPLAKGRRENPAEIRDDILKRTQAGVDQGTLMDEKQVRSMIKYPDRQALDSARDSGKISRKEWEIQDGYVKRAAELQQTREELAKKRGEKEAKQAEYDKLWFWEKWRVPDPGQENRPKAPGSEGRGTGGKFPVEPRK
jgi:hypothetical protein